MNVMESINQSSFELSLIQSKQKQKQRNNKFA